MVKKMGREELLASPEFKTNRWRIQNADALRVIIEEWLQTLPSDEEAIRILADELRLPVAPILSVGQFARNPHLGARMIENEDWRTPWEKGEDGDAVIKFEMEQFWKSVENLRALGLLKPRDNS